MQKTFGQNDPRIIDYVESLFVPEDEVLREIRDRSRRAGLPEIQVGMMDARHLEVIARATGAKKAVEVGTLGGYSGVSLMRGMGPEGRLYTFEYEPKHAEVARESFSLSGFESRVEIFVGPAVENLDRINAKGPFDLVFIDADKVSYPKYFSWALEHLRVGGVILADNTFAWGHIADKTFESAEDAAAVRALREINEIAARDRRLRGTILPTGEGLTMAVKVSA